MGGDGGWKVTSVLVVRSPGCRSSSRSGRLWVLPSLGSAQQAVAKERALFAWSLGNAQGQVQFGEDLLTRRRQSSLWACVSSMSSNRWRSQHLWGTDLGQQLGNVWGIMRCLGEKGPFWSARRKEGRKEGNREGDA